MKNNKVILVGNIGRDATTRTFNGGAVTSFSLATTQAYSGKDGQEHKETQWHEVEMWNASTNLQAFLLKGTKVLVSGAIIYNQYTDRNGNARAQTKIRAEEITLLILKSRAPSKDTNGGPEDMPLFAEQ